MVSPLPWLEWLDSCLAEMDELTNVDEPKDVFILTIAFLLTVFSMSTVNNQRGIFKPTSRQSLGTVDHTESGQLMGVSFIQASLKDADGGFGRGSEKIGTPAVLPLRFSVTLTSTRLL